MNRERIAIVHGCRSAFLKVGTHFNRMDADEIGAHVLKRLVLGSHITYKDIDEVIVGNVAQPSKAANVARVIALKGGCLERTPAYSVQRNCASGMEAVSTAMNKIWVDQANIIVAGGSESMTNIPFLFSKKMKHFFEKLSRSKSLIQTLSTFSSFRFSYLRPQIGLVDGLTDPICGQIMGQTAENLVKEFSISRDVQDRFALKSHQKANHAKSRDFFKQEITPINLLNGSNIVVDEDNSPRKDQSIDRLTKLKPYFDRRYGTVTVGNACPITDGAAMMILMKESEAQKRKLDVLGYLVAYDYAGLEPHRMGLGPVYATSKLFDRTGFSLKDMDLIEINEAFAAQVIANIRAFESKSFAKNCLGKDTIVGHINEDRLNVNGGAIALGHPVGATGARLLITLLYALKEKKLKRGLASLCVGGGLGGAFVVETE